jgi:D-alanyl-D-alanine carboxypeptidase-like protein
MASLRTLNPRFARIARQFVRALQSAGVRVVVTSARRSLDEQRRLYARAQAGLSKYPAAAPGSSTHGAGLAFDLNLDPPVYQEAGELWEHWGGTWGGRFKDPIHFDARPHA